jgi:hypothetical protein
MRTLLAASRCRRTCRQRRAAVIDLHSRRLDGVGFRVRYVRAGIVKKCPVFVMCKLLHSLPLDVDRPVAHPPSGLVYCARVLDLLKRFTREAKAAFDVHDGAVSKHSCCVSSGRRQYVESRDPFLLSSPCVVSIGFFSL